MPIIHDKFSVISGGVQSEVEADYFLPDTVAEAVEKLGEEEVMKFLHWAMRIDARSKVRSKFVVKFSNIGRGGTWGPRNG